jgi:hypothetical protein
MSCIPDQITTLKMKSLNYAVLMASIAFSSSVFAADAGLCEIRASLLGSVAQERDKGVSREKVKRQLPKDFQGMSPWIDIIYDKTNGMKPSEVAYLVKRACLAE